MLSKTYIFKNSWSYLPLLVLILFFSSLSQVKSQTNINDINFQAESEFQPTIKDAVKFTELPEIRDTVHRITNAN